MRLLEYPKSKKEYNMEIIKSILLGLIQGITEFLPVSSSGHLIIFEHFLGFDMQGTLAFELFLHFGTAIAVIIFFRKEIIKLLISLVKIKQQELKKERMFCLYLIIASFITAVIGFAFHKKIELAFSNPIVVSFLIFITGAIVFLTDIIKTKELKAENMGVIRSIIIGFGQTIAIIPGISRSGSTIATSLFAGLNRKDAATFSFILSIPVILGANLLKIKELLSLSLQEFFIYLIGALVALFSGYFVIKYLMIFIVKAKLIYIAIYCWLFASISVILLLIGF
jgi:undecaprenyl-diphosphatase